MVGGMQRHEGPRSPSRAGGVVRTTRAPKARAPTPATERSRAATSRFSHGPAGRGGAPRRRGVRSLPCLFDSATTLQHTTPRPATPQGVVQTTGTHGPGMRTMGGDSVLRICSNIGLPICDVIWMLVFFAGNPPPSDLRAGRRAGGGSACARRTPRGCGRCTPATVRPQAPGGEGDMGFGRYH